MLQNKDFNLEVIDVRSEKDQTRNKIKQGLFEESNQVNGNLLLRSSKLCLTNICLGKLLEIVNNHVVT